MVEEKRKNQKISWYCALCGAGHIIASAYDIEIVDREAKAVCKGGCKK